MKTDVDDLDLPSFKSEHTDDSKSKTLKAVKKIAERASEVAETNPAKAEAMIVAAKDAAKEAK